MATFTGEDLKKLIKANNKSRHISAKELGISEEELESYFLFESFEEPFINNIFAKLNLYKIIDGPDSVTPLALEIFEKYKNRIKLQVLISESFLTTVNELSKIAGQYAPELTNAIVEDFNNNLKEISLKIDF